MSRWSIALLCVLLPFRSVAGEPPQQAPAEVMIVGTYHFSNPGRDQHNVTSVDVLAPERQQQLQAIAKDLMKFAPTLVAIEWPADVVHERYASFRAGTLAPSHNEVVQLGFRLGALANLESIHGIDVDGDFPYEPVQAWAQANGAEKRLAAAQSKGEGITRKITEMQRTGTIGATLRDMNRPEVIADEYGFYAGLMHFGSGNDQPGAKLLAAWQARNLEICARLVQALRPGDRAVVFYGAGHSYLLRQCVSQTPGLKLVEPNRYLR